MNWTIRIFNVIVFAFLSIFLFASFLEAENKSTGDDGYVPQAVYGVSVGSAYDLAGESVPMDNEDALMRLDRELTVNAYWHSSSIINLKNANRFFPTIEKILVEEGVPADFKYLAVAESALRNVSSPAGAKGFWQIRKTAGKEMGLEINGEIDERYNLELSTRAACNYLKQNYKRFGSWTLAAAAYNMGPTKLRSEMNKQKETSYYDMNFGDETSRYVFRIIALKEIMSKPADYGFVLQSSDLYDQLDDHYTLQIDYQIDDLADFAHGKGITYRQLKMYNPWMLSSRLPNRSKKLYLIKIPKQM